MMEPLGDTIRSSYSVKLEQIRGKICQYVTNLSIDSKKHIVVRLPDLDCLAQILYSHHGPMKSSNSQSRTIFLWYRLCSCICILVSHQHEEGFPEMATCESSHFYKLRRYLRTYSRYIYRS